MSHFRIGYAILVFLAMVWLTAIGVIGFLLLRSDNPSPTSTSLNTYDLIVFTDTNPRQIILLDIAESTSQTWGQINYYNGEAWQQQPVAEKILTVADQKQVDQYSVQLSADFKIKNTPIQIHVPSLNLGMVIKSNESYTKFGGITSQSDTYLIMDGIPTQSRVVLLKGHDQEYAPLDLDALGIDTDWFVFLDSAGNWYHLDQTETEKYSVKYEPHQFFSYLSQTGPQSFQVNYLNNFQVTRTDQNLTVTQSQKSLLLTMSKPITRIGDNNWSTLYLLNDEQGGLGIYLKMLTD